MYSSSCTSFSKPRTVVFARPGAVHQLVIKFDQRLPSFRIFKYPAAMEAKRLGLCHKSISDFEFFEETDHITLYAYYERKNVIFEFDPNGGKFAQNEIENPYITVYDHTEGDFRQGFGYARLW